MLNLKNVKIAFFDLDGVLSIPRYRDIDGNISCGMLSEDWFITCQSTEDVYRDCEVPIKVINLLRRLKNNGTKLYVLTHETNSGAYFNKVNFILKITQISLALILMYYL